MSWILKAEGGTRAADRDEIRRALGILMDAGQTFELRGLPSGRSRICRGDDLDAAVEAAWDLSDGQVYYTLNPCRPDLEKAASNIDILRRKWFPVDVDAVRPVGVSATEEEKYAAVEVACEIAEHLSSRGWPRGLWIDSGNGGHILYPIDLPADSASQKLIRRALKVLAEKFDTGKAKVDKAVHNAARIFKLPGTFARKGPNTPERPHRMARVVSEAGDPGEIVTTDLLEALAGGADTNPKGGCTGIPSAPPVNGHANGHAPWTIKTPGKSKYRYVDQAIENECNRVRFARPGPEEGRNNALNDAAFRLGTLADWPEMRADVARAALRSAAIFAGLGESETSKTIDSGWNAGKASPRQRGDTPNGKHATAAPPRLAKYTDGLDEIEEEDADWLWENRIAIGFISIFAGRTGVGKSFVMCDVIARLSRGQPPPYSCLDRGVVRTLIISEDPVKVMLKPRLMALGADPTQIRVMTWQAMAQFTLGDVGMLDEVYEECGHPGLIMIDPPTNFLGDADEHKNSEVRSILMGLVAWLDVHRVACVLITHINKAVGKGLDAVERIIGSVAWGSTARITVAFIKDPDEPGTLLCGGTKNNLGPEAEAVAYKIAKKKPGDRAASIEWLGPIDSTIQEIMNQPGRKTKKMTFIDWLIKRFRERLKWDSKELEAQYTAAGFSRSQFFEVKAKLGIEREDIRDAAGKIVGHSQYVPADWRWLAEEFPDSGYSGIVARRNAMAPNRLRVVGQSPDSLNSGDSGDPESPPSPPSPPSNGCVPGMASEHREMRSRAVRQLVGILMSGPVPRDRVVAVAGELGIDPRLLEEAAEELGVERSSIDGQEVWSFS